MDTTFIDTIQSAFQTFLNSHTYAVLKFFLGLYTIVLILDIILLLSRRDLRSDVLKGRFGTSQVPRAERAAAAKKKWSAIEARLKSGNASEYKVALLEADAFMESVLERIGYKGANMAERLDQIDSAHMEDIDAVKEMHQLRNRIVFEQDFVLELSEAEKALKIYETALKKLDVL